MKRTNDTPRAAKELDAAFQAEGITVHELVKTLNETRTEAMRYSTKDGAPVGPDHVTRGKMAVELLGLLGLPAKSGAAEAPKSILDQIQASDRASVEAAGL